MPAQHSGAPASLAVQALSPDDPREAAGYRLRARLGAGGMGRVHLAYAPTGRPASTNVDPPPPPTHRPTDPKLKSSSEPRRCMISPP
ncbi:hypothetical protein GCM10010211_08580 [Streptomyces albospinus]|uniref:Protein kinase domain-containing protein n=1 Tax=Streptomyces albospinus TaxID=285515 RepID=A0ABQ2UNZ1_9ACTN|nr:hypothetical protein GCM10010211_08580 [Streptomyces albospinus]